MKRKPDILVVLAALLGLGMIFSSLSSINATNADSEYQVTQVQSENQ